MIVKVSKALLWKGIDDNCKDCIYDIHASGTWRMQIDNCIIKECKLYPYRNSGKHYGTTEETKN